MQSDKKDPWRTVYISGPMRGLPDLNFPAFNRAAELLRKTGFNVINPAELNKECGNDLPITYYMRRDIQVMVDDGVTDVGVLPGWRKSEGAMHEVATARIIGLPISEIVETGDGAVLVEEKPENILQEANRLIYGDRNADYGHPLDDFTCTGRLWAAILGVPEVTPEQVALCMVAVKISRQTRHHKRDNIVDGAGYFGTLAMVVEERERRAKAGLSETSS